MFRLSDQCVIFLRLLRWLLQTNFCIIQLTFSKFDPQTTSFRCLDHDLPDVDITASFVLFPFSGCELTCLSASALSVFSSRTSRPQSVDCLAVSSRAYFTLSLGVDKCLFLVPGPVPCSLFRSFSASVLPRLHVLLLHVPRILP